MLTESAKLVLLQNRDICSGCKHKCTGTKGEDFVEFLLYPKQVLVFHINHIVLFNALLLKVGLSSLMKQDLTYL